MPAPTLITSRLLLRHWRDSDLAAFAAMNADPLVMEHFPALLSRNESDVVAARLKQSLQEKDFGIWALEIPGRVEFAGFVGLSSPGFAAPFTPCVEIAWRLRSDCWGQGYATEAARAALDYGFNSLALAEVVSFTVTANQRSRNVMERLGMVRNPEEDFEHPSLPGNHPLRSHVLYRLARTDWHIKNGG